MFSSAQWVGMLSYKKILVHNVNFEYNLEKRYHAKFYINRTTLSTSCFFKSKLFFFAFFKKWKVSL